MAPLSQSRAHTAWFVSSRVEPIPSLAAPALATIHACILFFRERRSVELGQFSRVHRSLHRKPRVPTSIAQGWRGTQAWRLWRRRCHRRGRRRRRS